MLESYFFVPGDKKRYLEKMKDISADFFVIDLEDAVSSSNKKSAFAEVQNLSISNNTFVRVPFLDDDYTSEEKGELIQKFQGRIVLPKIKNVLDFETILSYNTLVSQLQIILLVENPQCYVNLKEILQKYSKHIVALGFGSHDFSSVIGMEHTLNHLMHYKKELIVHAKAFGVKYIDTVDIELKEFSNFKKECLSAFEMGAEGKFLIHPTQLQEMNAIAYFSDEEIQNYRAVFEKINSYNTDEIDILKIDGKIYEKPHIQRVKRIIEKLNT